MFADAATADFFRARLDHMIDLRQPLVVLASRMPWQQIEASLAHLFSRKGHTGLAMPDLDLFGEAALPAARQSNAGRPRIPLRTMIALLYLKHAFDLSDEAVVERWSDSPNMQYFSGMAYFEPRLPCDATTLIKFRRLLGANKLGEALFAKVGQELQARGFKLNTGTIVDATIIGAPSSTKNADKARDPEMHQTRKGQQWYFGMKLHIGVDSQSGLVHSAVVTAANVHDKHPLPDLLHGNEQRVYGDSAYASQKALIHTKATKAKDFTNQRTRRNGIVDEVVKSKNRNKSRIRARVEHVFGVIKRLWGFGKVRYRGLTKNATRAFTALALANIYLSRSRLMAQVRP